MRRGAGHSWESEIENGCRCLRTAHGVFCVHLFLRGCLQRELYGKMKMAATATLLIEELAQALWMNQGGRLTFWICGWGPPVSREVEHSDSNKAVLEEALVRRPDLPSGVCWPRWKVMAAESDGRRVTAASQTAARKQWTIL